MKAIVVGAGLFGCIIARGLRDAGHVVTILDNRQPLAGSPPAACLVKQEWVASLGSDVVDPAMAFLRSKYTEHTINFGKDGTSSWFDPRELLIESEKFDVSLVTKRGGSTKHIVGGQHPQYDTWMEEDADLVVIAAGIWSQNLVNWVDLGLTGKMGTAYLYQGFSQDNLIESWAPYKQVVGFDRGDGYWISDGTAIIPKNYSLDRKEQSHARCYARITKWGPPEPKELTGIRPYTVEKPCFCKEVSPGLWVAVGARKNGTLLGAWCAQKIVSEV